MNFKQLVQSGNFYILDTETTGLDDGSEIVQIAIIDSSGNTLLDTLVRPIKPIPASATRIHGITNEMVATAPTWADVRHQVAELLADRDVIIYNAQYDYSMLVSTDRVAGFTPNWDKQRCWDAMAAYAEYHGEWNDYYENYRWQRLTDAVRQMGLKIENAHHALGDCLMTLAVINAMCADPKYLATPAFDEARYKDLLDKLQLLEGELRGLGCDVNITVQHDGVILAI